MWSGTTGSCCAAPRRARFGDRNEVALPQPAGVLLAQGLLVGFHLVGVKVAVGAEQLRQYLAVAAGVRGVDRHARINRGDLHRRVEVRGRRAADDDRNAQPSPFQLLADAGHFVERRGDQPAQADALRAPRHRLLDDAFRLDHHAQVPDFVTVAGHHDRHDVLADVVHVAFHGGDQHFPRIMRIRGRPLFDIGRQRRHRAFHHAGGLHHLRQEHLALAEQRADLLHGRHQQRVDHGHRASQRLVTLQRILLHVVGHALEHRMGDTLSERPRTPCVGGLRLRLGRLLHPVGILREPLRGVGPAAEDHVLDAAEQFGFDLAVHFEHLRVDDAHVHSGPDGVVEERRVHRLAHRVVAAEGERKVRHAARDLRMGKVLLDPARRVDERLGVAVVLRNARCDGQHVGVENDVFGRKSVVRQ